MGSVHSLSNSPNLSNPTILGLASKTTKNAILPLYKKNGENYSPLYTDNALSNPAKKSISFELHTPTSQTEKNFFGPKRFIAIRPKKLVIADSGIFCYVDNENTYYKNIDRIVNVDLERFAISSVQPIDFNFMNISCLASTAGLASVSSIGVQLYDQSASEYASTLDTYIEKLSD